MKPTEVPAETCGASTGAIRLGDEPPFHVGPCVLRKDHDGPVHQAADGVEWVGNVGRDPTAPRPDVPDDLLIAALHAASDWEVRSLDDSPADHVNFMNQALHAVVPEIERQVRERVAAEITETIDADVPGQYEAGLERAARIARGES